MRGKFEIRPCLAVKVRSKSQFSPKIRPRIPLDIPTPAKKAKSMRFKSRLLPSPVHSQKPRLIYLVFYKSAHLA